MQATFVIIRKKGNQFGKNPMILSIYIPINLFSLPLGSTVYTVQSAWIPSSPLPDRFIIFDIVTSISPASRNCFIHSLLSIHCVILATSSGLFIIASNYLSLACWWKSPHPFAQCKHTNTMWLTFCDGYPHWQFGLSTPGTFLLHR